MMAALEPFLGKKYILKSSENLEEYLKFIEIGYVARKAASAMTPVISLELNSDGSYTLLAVTVLKTIRIDFTLGEEFIETRADGAKNKSTMNLEGNKLIQISIEGNGRKSTHVREFSANQVTVTSTAEGWDGRCYRVYELMKYNN